MPAQVGELVKPGYGIVVARTRSTPGPASTVTYTVRYVTNEGDLPDVQGQIPFTRWTATDIVPHAIGFNFPIVIAGSQVIPFFPPEPPHVTECQG